MGSLCLLQEAQESHTFQSELPSRQWHLHLQRQRRLMVGLEVSKDAECKFRDGVLEPVWVSTGHIFSLSLSVPMCDGIVTHHHMTL